ncbi:transposase [Sporolactobacillus nakayamae]|uniref:transposase n=1 Tax=Sporolactobacillus nakayamae TaxID=269670 RepID=UPI000B85D772
MDPNKNWRDCSNLEKQRLKVTKLYAKVNNRKTDFLHKRSTELVKSHDLLVVEDLPVKSLVKNHHLAKSIHDVSWSPLLTC